MKYISPGGWFSLEYPAGWREFEDTEESFLFYDPDKWSGNFRISAYRGGDRNYGADCLKDELKENPSAAGFFSETGHACTTRRTFRKRAHGTRRICG